MTTTIKSRVQLLLATIQSALADANEIYNDLNDDESRLGISEDLYKTLEKAEWKASALLESLQ